MYLLGMLGIQDAVSQRLLAAGSGTRRETSSRGRKAVNHRPANDRLLLQRLNKTFQVQNYSFS